MASIYHGTITLKIEVEKEIHKVYLYRDSDSATDPSQSNTSSCLDSDNKKWQGKFAIRFAIQCCVRAFELIGFINQHRQHQNVHLVAIIIFFVFAYWHELV